MQHIYYIHLVEWRKLSDRRMEAPPPSRGDSLDLARQDRSDSIRLDRLSDSYTS